MRDLSWFSVDLLRPWMLNNSCSAIKVQPANTAGFQHSLEPANLLLARGRKRVVKFVIVVIILVDITTHITCKPMLQMNYAFRAQSN